MEKQILEDLVAKGFKRNEIATELNVHVNTIYYWMLKYELQTRPKKLCNKCGQDDPNKFDPDRHTRCRKCRGQRTRVKKQKAVDYKGGECINCGYKNCIAALDFHHRNPKEKDFQWNTLRHKSWDAIVQELNKCDLLCKNCHTELHWKWNNKND